MQKYAFNLGEPRLWLPPKILMIMKLIVIMMTTCLLQVSAASFAQKMTMVRKNTTLAQVFKEITLQTGYEVLYSDQKIDVDRKIDVNFYNTDLKEVLGNCLEGQKLDFAIEDKVIVIKPKTPSFLDRVVAQFAAIDVRGRVVDEAGSPLVGATIQVRGKAGVYKSNDKGEFEIKGVDEDAVLLVSYVGFKPLEISLKGAVMPLEIKLNVATGELEEVNVTYSTGYQTLPKERATGSFVQIDNELFNRKVGATVLDRLKDVASGLSFYNRKDGTTDIQVRGLSTLRDGFNTPLIVVDNFPYEGNINNINPNDVENITILKDAAAASIWGAAAGNGVIVITTKKGKYNQPASVSFNSNYTTEEKPDLYAIPRMTSSDMIDVEQYLFGQGFYDANIDNTITRPALTPVVEILAQQRSGKLTQPEATNQVNALRNNDVRKDFLKYIYRNSSKQQYALNLSGGSGVVKYIFASGYDKNLSTLYGNQNDRLTFRTNTTIAPLKGLELNVGVSYIQSSFKLNSPGGYEALNYNTSTQTLYPYARFADGEGNHLAIANVYRLAYLDTVGKGRLLDWKFRPLDELTTSDNSGKLTDLTINLGVSYKFSKSLSLDLKYQYEKQFNRNSNYRSTEAYFTRNLINRFTQISGNTIKYNVPNSGILSVTDNEVSNYNWRGQLNYANVWGRHELNVLSGAEIRQVNTSLMSPGTLYGYNKDLLTSSNMDFVTRYPTYIAGRLANIPNAIDLRDLTNRYISVFANAGYTFNERHTLSASARKDASNLYGVKTNDKGAPLWSAGYAWNISKEDFFENDIIPYLRLSTAYGYNGNVSKTNSAYAILSTSTGTYGSLSIPFANIANAPNPTLRWEKVRIWKVAADFRLKDDRIGGSLEYYKKQTKDLLATELLDVTTGFSSINTNSANTKGSGIEITLNSRNIDHIFKWNSSVNFSTNKTAVTKYLGTINNIGGYAGGDAAGDLITPFLDRDPYAFFSYKWAGLNPQTGNPMGMLEGKATEDYDAIYSKSTAADLVFHGSGRPIMYGNILNSFELKGVSLSVNATFKLKYYKRVEGLNYDRLFNNFIGHPEYQNRWQKPGDEQFTSVPSLDYNSSSARNTFRSRSDIMVRKGDHIRVDDIRLGYFFTRQTFKGLPFRKVNLYASCSNLNLMIWKANKGAIDPDNPDGIPLPRNFSIGISIN